MNFVILGILLNELSRDLDAGYIDSSLRKATEEALIVASQMVRRPACPSAIQCKCPEMGNRKHAETSCPRSHDEFWAFFSFLIPWIWN